MPHLGSPGLSDPMGGNIKFTRDGGIAIRVKNQTGHTSVRGEVVEPSDSVADSVKATTNASSSPCGVVLDNGVAVGAWMWVVFSGCAYVLLGSDQTAALGDWLGTYTESGRAESATEPPATSKHDQEIGHVLEAGTGLVRSIIHFR